MLTCVQHLQRPKTLQFQWHGTQLLEVRFSATVGVPVPFWLGPAGQQQGRIPMPLHILLGHTVTLPCAERCQHAHTELVLKIDRTGQ